MALQSFWVAYNRTGVSYIRRGNIDDTTRAFSAWETGEIVVDTVFHDAPFIGRAHRQDKDIYWLLVGLTATNTYRIYRYNAAINAQCQLMFTFPFIANGNGANDIFVLDDKDRVLFSYGTHGAPTGIVDANCAVWQTLNGQAVAPAFAKTVGQPNFDAVLPNSGEWYDDSLACVHVPGGGPVTRIYARATNTDRGPKAVWYANGFMYCIHGFNGMETSDQNGLNNYDYHVLGDLVSLSVDGGITWTYRTPDTLLTNPNPWTPLAPQQKWYVGGGPSPWPYGSPLISMFQLSTGEHHWIKGSWPESENLAGYNVTDAGNWLIVPNPSGTDPFLLSCRREGAESQGDRSTNRGLTGAAMGAWANTMPIYHRNYDTHPRQPLAIVMDFANRLCVTNDGGATWTHNNVQATLPGGSVIQGGPAWAPGLSIPDWAPGSGSDQWPFTHLYP